MFIFTTTQQALTVPGSFGIFSVRGGRSGGYPTGYALNMGYRLSPIPSRKARASLSTTGNGGAKDNAEDSTKRRLTADDPGAEWDPYQQEFVIPKPPEAAKADVGMGTENSANNTSAESQTGLGKLLGGFMNKK